MSRHVWRDLDDRHRAGDAHAEPVADDEPAARAVRLRCSRASSRTRIAGCASGRTRRRSTSPTRARGGRLARASTASCPTLKRAAHFDARFYDDTWGVIAGNVELGYSQYIGNRCCSGPRPRLPAEPRRRSSRTRSSTRPSPPPASTSPATASSRRSATSCSAASSR